MSGKKIDPMKDRPAGPRDPFEREVYRIMDQIQTLIQRHPNEAQKLVYALLGNAIAMADAVGVDVLQFERELREKFVRPPPMVLTDKGWRTES